MIPVLRVHNPGEQVGSLVGAMLTFEPFTVTKEMMFDSSWSVIEQDVGPDGTVYIRRAKLLELIIGVPRDMEAYKQGWADAMGSVAVFFHKNGDGGPNPPTSLPLGFDLVTKVAELIHNQVNQHAVLRTPVTLSASRLAVEIVELVNRVGPYEND